MWPFKKEKWALVKTIEIDLDCHHVDKAFYYLYESNVGNRKWKHKSIYSSAVVLPAAYYQIVFSWFQGQDFKDIPSYWQVVKEQRKNDIRMMYRRFCRR